MLQKPVKRLDHLQDSSGNIFQDLGYSREDAEFLRLRADLMAAVRKWISENRLTTHEAAEILHVSQPRITDLQRGKWDRFSLEKLIVLTIRSGFNLAISRTRCAKVAQRD